MVCCCRPADGDDAPGIGQVDLCVRKYGPVGSLRGYAIFCRQLACLGRRDGRKLSDSVSDRIHGDLNECRLRCAGTADGDRRRPARPLAGAPQQFSRFGQLCTERAVAQCIAGLSGWWDASYFSTALGSDGTPVPNWGAATASLGDKSGNGKVLVPYSVGTSAGLPLTTARLSGLLGGRGRVAGGTGTVAPALDPDLGFQIADVSFQANANWTRYLVWSRPNRRQNSGHDAQPITLLTAGGISVLQADIAAGHCNLTLFPGSPPGRMAALGSATAGRFGKRPESQRLDQAPG